MRVIFLGCPGSGKGTQAIRLAKRLAIPQISTGDMLRQAITQGSSMGLTAKSYLDAGELVPDEVMIALVRDRLNQSDCRVGFLLDGFPRTEAQAQALLKHHIHIDYVFNLTVPTQEVIKRITGRRVHLASGRVYHLEYNPPKVSGIDDLTGEPLTLREDDQEDTVIKRLEVYHSQSEPLKHFYQQRTQHDPDLSYADTDGLGTTEAVAQRIDAIIDTP